MKDLTQSLPEMAAWGGVYVALAEALRTARSGLTELQAREAPDFRLFDLTGSRETMLSRVIGDLLDPASAHGQGALLLNGLLAAFGLPEVSASDQVSVRCEAPTREGRRIDLVIETPTHLIGIENKPWAGQSEAQLKDYLKDLKLSCGQRRKPVLIFLSEQEPETAREETQILRFRDHGTGPSLEALLREALEQIRPPPMRWVCESLLHLIAQRFGGVPAMSESDLIVSRLVETHFADPAGREAIAAAVFAAEVVGQTLSNEIGSHLLARLQRDHAPDMIKASECDALGDVLAHPREVWLLRRPHWPQGAGLAISSFGAPQAHALWGLIVPGFRLRTAPGAEAGLSRALRGLVRTLPGSEKPEYDWPWWVWAPEGTWSAQLMARWLLEAPQGDLSLHPRVRAIGDQLLALAAAFDHLLDSASASPDL